MKKILFFASFVLAFAFAKAGSYELTYNNDPLRFGDTIILMAADGECDFYFDVNVYGLGQTPTFIDTRRTNEGATFITSICADNWCVSNTTEATTFTPNAFPFESNATYRCHIEFDAPDGSPNTFFKINIYNENNASDNYVFYVKVVTNSAAIHQELSALNGKLSVYPNPATAMVNVTLDSDIDDVVVIYNTLGTIVKKAAITSGHATLDVSNLPSGVYLYGLNNSKGLGLKKLVVR